MRQTVCRVALVIWLVLLPLRVAAAGPAPAQSFEAIRNQLVQAQLDLRHDPAAAQHAFDAAQAAYNDAVRAPITDVAPQTSVDIATAFDAAQQALDGQRPDLFARARSHIWTGLLAGSYAVLTDAIGRGDGATAQMWLPAREYRTATRFSRPATDATQAVEELVAGTTPSDAAAAAVRAELLDTYQANMVAAFTELKQADAQGFTTARTEQAALAQGYFAILTPAYVEQRGPDALNTINGQFARLQDAALSGDGLDAALADLNTSLHGFRAAPLTEAEQTRRAAQLLRFLHLVPVEYERGVRGDTVTNDLEIREAITFFEGSLAAFNDLQPALESRDAARTAQIATAFEQLGQYLDVAGAHGAVISAKTLTAHVDDLSADLHATMPAEWLKHDVSGDFDVISSMLDQMESAIAAGQYDVAEAARLEAYAILESGPEARLVVFAPEHKVMLEDLFWYGKGEHPGLAYLIKQRAPAADIRRSRVALDAELVASQKALGGSAAPGAVIGNAAIIVFREGLEAVLILASLMGSLKMGDNRRLRRPLWIGAAGALLASALTWMLARGILQSLARYGERLEAVVSLIAIGVLLLITNWFFHKVYWTGWMANFHTRKRRLMTGSAGLWLGLMALGFSSIYREGFETVLFLQALVLESGSGTVLSGVAIGLLGTAIVGVLVFVLQTKLPHKKMLIVTGVMIGGVLLVMVGNTTHVLQVVGWLPTHPIRSLSLPAWVGLWTGFYATWEGVSLQLAAAAFVIGSYVLAEHLQHRRSRRAVARTARPASSGQRSS